MMPLQNTASKVIVAQASTATNATAAGYVDTLGFDEAAVDVFLNSAAATSSNPSVLRLMESDDTETTNFAAITGFTGDATDGFTIPAADTANAQIVRMNVDCRARKRYLRVEITPAGAAQVVGAQATLGKAGDSTVARAEMAAVQDG